MPKIKNLSTIKIGKGLINSSSVPPEALENKDNAMEVHLGDSQAHSDTEISVDGDALGLESNSLREALESSLGKVPAPPPRLGYFSRSYSVVDGEWAFSGIPDWGVLKMANHSLTDKNLLSTSIPDADVFPYFYVSPSPALDTPEFDTNPGLGGDPASDPIFNTDSGVTGGGDGTSFCGAYVNADGDMVRTTQIRTRSAVIDGGTGKPTQDTVTVSGCLFPADKGVLALLHWPARGEVAEFLAQDLTDRCVAAILLGAGVIESTSGGNCDGEPGGIFGDSLSLEVFPSRASGQYNYSELVAGVSALDGTALRAPFNDLDGDSSPGFTRVSGSNTPIPGQVRLGSDPLAGETPTAYGIPVLGSTSAAYSSTPSSIGNSVLSSSNFFGYRLPMLEDYSEATGLKFTPRGRDPRTTKESARYFSAVSPASSATLETAGNYPSFENDNMYHQLARFRHSFKMSSEAAAGTPEEAGTYLLMHFKTEKDFEAFTRDGIMPDDVTSGYTTYSASIDFSSGSPEVTANVVNEADSTADSPAGPAPDYGYAASPYHLIRSNIFLDNLVFGDVGTFIAKTFTWDQPFPDQVSYISGVAYFASEGFSIVTVDIDAGTGFWENSFNTDDTTLTSGADPALLSSPNPAFLGLQSFVQESHTNYTVPVGAAAAGTYAPSSTYKRNRGIEIPFTHLGLNGTGYYSDANPPVPADDLDRTFTGDLVSLGNEEYCTLSQDAKLRLYLRKVRFQNYPYEAALPYSANDGHGIVLDPNPSAQLLWHGVPLDDSAYYGNFLTGAAPSPAIASTVFAEKDYTERFLDEVYRLVDPLTWLSDALELAAINGPGLGLIYGGGAIEFPIRAGVNTGNIQADSFVQNELHLTALPSNGLQVAGLPDRNPPTFNGISNPIPQNGILLYPQKDYSTGYRPSDSDGDITSGPQPDYSSSTGVRTFLRCFDANLGSSRNITGANSLSIKINGLGLQDFAYSSGNTYGGVGGDSGIAILVKLPGLTAWMDLGRRDGEGPSKYSGTQDGAGCQVLGDTYSYEDYDSQTGIIYSIVKISFGNLAAIFTNTGVNNSEVGTAPILIKVVMDETAVVYNLEREYQDAPGSFAAGSYPGISSDLVRGLTGIQII